jgi:hypothetical protein
MTVARLRSQNNTTDRSIWPRRIDRNESLRPRSLFFLQLLNQCTQAPSLRSWRVRQPTGLQCLLQCHQSPMAARASMTPPPPSTRYPVNQLNGSLDMLSKSNSRPSKAPWNALVTLKLSRTSSSPAAAPSWPGLASSSARRRPDVGLVSRDLIREAEAFA